MHWSWNANVASHCFTACDAKLPTSLNSDRRGLLFDPPARVAWPGCARLYCAECVYVWKLGSVVLDLPNLEVASGTPHTHVQTRQCARPCWISPNVNYFRMLTFLKNTNWPTYTNGRKGSSNPLSVFIFYFFFFRIYGLDLGLLPAFSQCHLKGESELITSAVPWAR